MNILAIGGSDPSSGAGIQSDILAAQALGANCFSVITAITAQNSKQFSYAEPVSAKSIGMQIDSVLSDFDVDAITIGMVYDTAAIKAIHAKLKNAKIPIILDPVIKSTTGGVLLKKDAISALKKLLIPICNTITPNVAEAELISGVRIRKPSDLLLAAKALSKLGAKNIIITGHFLERGKISDFVFDGTRHQSIPGKKLSGQNHGSGCNFAIAVSLYIARKKNIFDSAKFAKQFTYDSIKSAQRLGRGLKITRPGRDQIQSELAESIKKFENLKEIHAHIPECQTNFVFAKPKAKTTGDVLGVSGRIVKAGTQAITAGSLEYGGSRHVATAVLTMQKKFPKIRSAINIRYDESTIKKFAKSRAKIASYNRLQEPKSSRQKENSSISWGVSQAIQNLSTPPDIIYHKGDFGKEPMIIVFGTAPSEVLQKLAKIL
ncbi:bifunctional hydroxymethylpyrimidine kinase/phosphomethylpyrimidine kinase [Candidatus Nitrosotenuis aquarius]|uniref:bifunctional hydroxymethylpyrimidine kinase/phosphomethylpyrimidine kinase n=1 Tax=Candidatus Nitrosotenuis aquarius TaxID=1846278 RepID=UPI000C1F0DEC|nr:bifunctional hydroxymethylpyrimidine kinase/phosphomethylpyrimidine kinase [Candidatus Nitrosotenuis aquarius]